MSFEYLTVDENYIKELERLQREYKKAIKEDDPTERDFSNMLSAIKNKEIVFYACKHDGRLVGCCSVSSVFSTFDYLRGGVFEDFYIMPEYRHKGIARALVKFAYEESGISTLTVGSADCDVGMYKALGFSLPIGNLLAYYGQKE